MGIVCSKTVVIGDDTQVDSIPCKVAASMGVDKTLPAEQCPEGDAIKYFSVAAEGKASSSVAEPLSCITSKLRTNCKVRDAYKLGKTLGTGGFAVVKLATCRRTGEQYACKIMALPAGGADAGGNESTREDILKEIDIVVGLAHPNVVYLKEYFEEGNKVYLITELVTGGELLEAVLQRGTYSEAEARRCFVQLMQGIEYLHSQRVVHRDLKLENLLLASRGDISGIKIADFGLAKQSAGALSTVCGTPQYVAPEVIQGAVCVEYGPPVDMWSAGVVLFILLGGYPPFYNDSEPALFEQIRAAAYNFDDPVWASVSNSAKDLICHLLVADPGQRLSASQALAHPWASAGELPSDHLTGAVANMRQQLALGNSLMAFQCDNFDVGCDSTSGSGVAIAISCGVTTPPAQPRAAGIHDL